ncbi:glycosyltransferase [Noviherbaspirillum massiliense]|uniref:glycosyltransferase n=1 Tax=Noviherbaspirillum massiliense TaxID=1465823 RepID=UPI0002DCCFBB|nr:glycosyltransferase [Noviherbaspirillum massiliense]
MNKRALIIAFHFPPQAASSGIQRTLSFSRHLGRYGWEPLVLSAHPMAYSAKNPSQLASIPSSVVVRRPYALDAKRHLGLFGRYPGILALPDRWISWWFSAVPAGLALIRKYKPEVIWSTFPIATSHLIGLTLHRLTGIPWIADFRDPMLQPGHPETWLQRRCFAWIERQAIRHCCKAVFTTHSALDSYRQRFPGIAPDKFMVIENGYDEEGFQGIAGPSPSGNANNVERRITLLHSGVLYPDGRDPSSFFEAISRLKADGRASPSSLSVILRATGDAPYFLGLAKKHAVDDIVRIEPPLPYREALREMLEADGLLAIQGTPFNTQVPAKIYEYFRARRPIFALVDPRGETARVLEAAGFRNIVPIDSADRIVHALPEFISDIRQGRALCASDELIAASSRAHRARQLATLFSQACLQPAAAWMHAGKTD